MSESNTKVSILDWIVISIAILGFALIVLAAFIFTEYYSVFLLLAGVLLLLLSSYFVYKVIDKRLKEKQKWGSLWLAFVLANVFFFLSVFFSPFSDMEERAISWRFQILKKSSFKEEIRKENGDLDRTEIHPPADARKDIQIIGITTDTLENLGATWPIPWGYYANIINNFAGTQNNQLMFDIFFVDDKPGQTDQMVEALEHNREVLFDYPMEASLESKAAVKNLDSRVEVLRQKFRLENVKDPDSAGVSWVQFPQPPIVPIAELAAGLGFANIKKDDSGLNRKMPLVVKLTKFGPYGEDEYYPSIDLVIACRYYGVDIKKDVEVVMGQYVKIKNIPKKEIRELNRNTLKLESHDVMNLPNENREVVIPIDEEGQMQINFVGGRYAFNSYELYEAATQWTPETASQLRDKIILVAMYYATGRGASKDSHLSPFGEMSGIEHHAHALNTILNQDFLRNTNVWQNLLIFLFIGLLVGFVQPRLNTALGFLLLLVLLVGYSALSLYDFAEFDLIHPFPIVLMEQLFIFFGIVGFRILTEEANVKYIRSTFSKFVSKDVVDELLKNPDNLNLGGSKREITIFFSDVRGFTTISEQLGPEELVQLLNEYLSDMTELIIEFKGTIDKYMGDAIMAFWGAPVPLEEHAYYACIAALAQMKHLKTLQVRWQERGWPPLDIGIGLNTGPAVVGNMGSSHRMEYTCMGDTINLGSRLEGSNKMYTTNIIMSEYTYEMVKDRVIARELDLVRVKGKNKPVRIYELIDLVNEEDLEKMKRPLQETAKAK